MQQLSQLDYEAIENAVMETARGRWFLSEYKKRHAGASTSTLLDAIGRLEKVVTTLGDGSYQSDKADTTVSPIKAIAETKTAISVAAPSALVTDAPTPEQTPLNDENLKFFSNDEDLFSDDANDLLPDASVQNSQSADDVTPVDASPQESILDAETADISDRFKVFRTDTTTEVSAESVTEDNDTNIVPAKGALFGETAPSQDGESAPETEIQAVETPVVDETVENDPVVPDPAIQATDEEKDRIVIIRGSSDASHDIPFGDDIFGDNQDKPSVS